MYVNLVVAIIVLAIAIDRFWVISRASRLNVSKKFGDDLEARLSRGDTAGALALCRGIATPEASWRRKSSRRPRPILGGGVEPPGSCCRR